MSRNRFALITLMVLMVLPSGCLGRRTVPPKTGQTAGVEELKAGMTGYCLSPYEGGQDRLQFEIVGVDPTYEGYLPQIIARIHDGHSLAGKGVPRGMSGSPLYLEDGRLIGVLARTYDDPFGTILVTPVAELLKQADRVSVDGWSGPVPAVPSYAAFCTVWGDANHCSFATISLVKGGLAYATGHELKDMTTGPKQELGVFYSSVMTTIHAQVPYRYGTGVGGPMGASVFNGEFGTLIELGRKAQQFDVHLNMDDGRRSASRVLYGARQSPYTPAHVDAALRSLVKEQLDISRPWDARITVTMEGQPNPLIIEDEWDSAVSALLGFLTAVSSQSPQAIGSVTVDIRPPQDATEYDLVKLEAVQKPLGASVQVTLKRSTDNEYVGIRQTILENRKAETGLGWHVGRALQSKVLERMSALASVPVLNQITERRCLYLACLSCQSVAPIPENADQPVPLQPQVLVITRLSLGRLQVQAAPDLAFTYVEPKK